MAIIDILNIDSENNIDRTYGIKKIIKLMSEWGVSLKDSKTLDMFAGDGSWCSNILLSLVNTNSVCWDIDPFKLDSIKQKFNLKTKNGDIFKLLKNNKEKYNIIHCDNPSSVYGDKDKKYEYFDVIPFIKDLFDKECIFIHNLNSAPYNFDNKSKWAKKRQEFYNLEDTSNLNIDNTILFHKKYFEDNNIKVHKCKAVEREMYNGKVYWWYLVYKLEKQ